MLINKYSVLKKENKRNLELFNRGKKKVYPKQLK